MAKVGDMMREQSETFGMAGDQFRARRYAHELTLMSTDARLAWLTAAPEEQLIELGEYLVDRLRAADWTQRLREAQNPDLATLFGHFRDAQACYLALERAEITLVFTSHPSELRPPHILGAFADVEVDSTDEQLTTVLGTLGNRLRTVRPLVTDEIDAMIARAQNTLFDGIRDHILRVRAAWEQHYGAPEDLLPLSLRLLTWVGADRDGNPSVTAPTTLQAGLRYAHLARETHARWLLDAQKTVVSNAELQNAIGAVRLLAEDATVSAAEFSAALEAVLQSTRAHGEPVAERIVYAAAVFARAVGFQMLALEWRENAAVIFTADAETARGEKIDSDDLSPATRDLLASLCAVAQLRRDFGPDAVQTLIISNSENVAVLFALKRLAQACGVLDSGPIHIVPLLESINALQHAPDFMRQLLAARFFDHGETSLTPRYCEAMLGYSDAAKDGGRLMADECIRRAQRELAEVCAEYGTVPYVFHGRGGTPARGAATIDEAFADLLPALPIGVIKQTEQGEVIANRYGHSVLTAQNFDRFLFDALDQQLHENLPENDVLRELMERLAQDAFITYRALRNDPNFLAHLMAITPLLAVCRMPLGSRPAARVEARSSAPFTLERLRAIPLNMAVNVAHVQVPAWYGTGRALAHELGINGAQQLRHAYRTYAPLRTSLNRAVRALAATDFTYVHERADVAGSDQLSAFVADLEAEADRLRAGLLLLGVPPVKRSARDDATLLFHDFQRALYRRTRVGRDVSFELESLAIAAAVASNGMSG